jgi:hypothetical protein
MIVITLIGHLEQALIEPALICPTFVSANQQNGLSLWVKSKSHSPDLAAPRKPELFHVGMSRTLEGVYGRSSQVRAKLREQFGMCEQFVLKLFHHGLEFGVKGIVKKNSPSHEQIMDLKTYGVKSILIDLQTLLHQVATLVTAD